MEGRAAGSHALLRYATVWLDRNIIDVWYRGQGGAQPPRRWWRGSKRDGKWGTKAAGEYPPAQWHAFAKYIAVTQPVVAAEEPRSSASSMGPSDQRWRS